MAEFSLGDAILKTGIDLSGLLEGLDEAEKTSEDRWKGIGDTIGNVLKAGVLAAGVAVVGAIGAIGAQALDVASQTDAAARSMQASLGLTADEAEKLSQVALDVFGDNWYGSVEEAGAAVTEIRKQLGEMSDDMTRQVAGGVAAIADNFGEEAPKIIDAVKAIRDNFPGTTEQEALDMIAAGFQRGLNSSGDFLDSIGEYSVQFGESGSTAAEFFSVMETGMQSGVLGTDKIADAFKESRIRIMEMSDEVVEAFRNIGEHGIGKELAEQFGDPNLYIDSIEKAEAAAALLESKFEGIDIDPQSLLQPLTMVDEKTGETIQQAQQFGDIFMSQVLGGVEAGTISMADAQQLAIDGLRQMDNQVWQNTAGVQIFGTQWEDLGATALLSVDSTKTSLDDLSGATDSLNAKYGSFSDLQEGLGRKALVALEPLGDKLLDLANNAMPMVEVAFAWLENDLPPIIDQVVNVISFMVALVSNLINGPLGESLRSNASTFSETFNGIIEIANLVGEIIGIVFDGIRTLLTTHSGQIRAVTTAAWSFISSNIQTTLNTIKGVLSAAVQFMRGDWEGGFNTLKNTATNALNQAKSNIEGIVGGIRSILNGMFDGIKSKAEGAFNGLGNIVKGAMESAISNIKAGLNSMIDAMNNAIRGFNQLPGPDLPLIPRLARGTDNFAGGVALVGEEGPELTILPRGAQVIPARRTSQLLNQAANSGIQVHVSMEDGGMGWLRNLIRVEIREWQNETAATAQRRGYA